MLNKETLKSCFDKVRGFLARRVYAPVKHKRLRGVIKITPLRALLRIVLWLSALTVPAVCYAVVEYFHFKSIGNEMFLTFMRTRTEIAVAMVTLFYLFWIVLLLICKKPSIASGVLAAVSIAFGITNHYKYILTGDFFYPWDFVQAGNLGHLGGFVGQGLPVIFIIAAIVLIVLVLLPSLTNEAVPLKWYIRLPIAAVIVFCMFHTVSTPEKGTAYLHRHGMMFEGTALQMSNYVDNGFCGGFTTNLMSMRVNEPEGYSQERVEQILAPYHSSEASADFRAPDVIVILSESFWDPKNLPGSTFTDLEGNEIDPIANFTEIASRPGAISGLMANTALGGGTVRPEFEVLTGVSTDYLPSGSVPYQFVDDDMEAYPSMFRELGYSTYSVHPYDPAFYSRKTGYPKIGIDSLAFETDITDYSANSDWQWQWRGKYVSDISFVEYMEITLDRNTESPSFMMGISMEAHQPYETKYNPEALEIIAGNDRLDDSLLTSFQNFTMAMYDADTALGELVRYIDERERDTILIYFGDHLPTLGANNAAYVQSGMIADAGRSGENDVYLTQQTPFLIYANFELGQGALLHEGSDNRIASYNLLNGVCQLIGAPRTRYMEWMSDFGLEYPAYNVRMRYPMTDGLAKRIEEQRIFAYDRTVGKRWSMIGTGE